MSTYFSSYSKHFTSDAFFDVECVQSSMKLHFDSDNAVTFRLVEGNGPVHIAAEHVVGKRLTQRTLLAICECCDLRF